MSLDTSWIDNSYECFNAELPNPKKANPVEHTYTWVMEIKLQLKLLEFVALDYILFFNLDLDETLYVLSFQTVSYFYFIVRQM